jgi:hypothetical protein
VFRKPSKIRLETIVDFDDVATGLPVIQEVLKGFNAPWHSPVHGKRCWPFRSSNPRCATTSICTQSNCTETNVKGAIRSGVVCLIAACAMHNQLEVVHADRDYDAIAGISSLRAKNIAPRIQRS